jgi:hypothetical protein
MLLQAVNQSEACAGRYKRKETICNTKNSSVSDFSMQGKKKKVLLLLATLQVTLPAQPGNFELTFILCLDTYVKRKLSAISLGPT